MPAEWRSAAALDYRYFRLLTAEAQRRPPDTDSMWIPAATTTNLAFGGGGHSYTMDTADLVLGDGSLKVVTVPGSTATVTFGVGGLLPGPVDLTGRYLRVWVKVDNAEQITTLSCLAGNAALTSFYTWKLTEGWGVGVQQWVTDGEWIAVDLPFGLQSTTGTPDRANIEVIRFRANDNGSPLSVRFGGIEVVDEPSQGVLSLTFDDWRANQFTLGRPILAKYGLRGTFYAVGDFPYGTESQLDVMHKLGHEIACHCDALADHQLPNGFNDMTEAELTEKLLHHQYEWMERGYRGAAHIAYPKGRHNATVQRVVRRYFRSGRTTAANTNLDESLYAPAPHHLQSKNVAGSSTAASIATALARAIANKTWLIYVFHDIDDVGSGGATTFDEMMAEVVNSGIAVRTIGEVVRGDF